MRSAFKRACGHEVEFEQILDDRRDALVQVERCLAVFLGIVK